MRTRLCLTAADVRILMQAARAEAEGLELEVSIAIVDEAGILLALERLDGARLHTPEAAWLKSRTAAIARTPTASLEAQVHANPALLSFPGRMPLAGGMPLLHGGEVVGGVGSSGAQPEQDERVCQAALDALGRLEKAEGQGVLRSMPQAASRGADLEDPFIR